MRRLIQIHLVLLILIGVTTAPTHAQPATPTPEMQTVVDGNTDFAFDLYHALRGEQGNMIYSPYSIWTALALVYAGAREDTELQMAESLHFDLPQSEFHAELGALDDLLTTIDSEFGEEPFQLNVANAVWAQDGYPLQPDYTALLDEHYGAGVQIVDFVNASEDARLTINGWVSQQTNDRIPELLPPGSVDALSRLILTNAIYFSATWRTLFDEAETYDEAFTLLDGSQVQVPMMHMRNQFWYVEGDNFQVMLLDYQPEADVQMMIILPRSGGFAEVEAMLDGDWFRQTYENIWLEGTWNLIVTMPRFEASMNVELSDALIGLGMEDAFQPSANFADLAQIDEPFFISGVIHQAFIKVDEEGTEAAAATAIGLGGGGPPNEPFDFRMDRPFIYLITHRETGAILFMGRVLNPLG